MLIPTSFRLTSLPVTSNYPIIKTTSQSGKTLKRNKEGQRWQCTLSWSRLSQNQLRELRALFTGVGQGLGQFQVVLPRESQPLGAAEGTPVVQVAATVGSTTVAVQGLTAGQLELQAGSFIKAAGHNKVYMLTADLTGASDGTGTLQIFPGLVAEVAAAELLVWRDIPFTFEMDDDPLEWSANDWKSYTLEVDVTEKL